MMKTRAEYVFSVIAIACFALSLTSCNNKGSKEQKPLAVVYDKYLYKSDIADIFPKGITKNDSLKMLNVYVDQWVRHNLMLRLSEEKLSDNQKNVSKQLEDYRSSLLIFKYEQEYLNQKLDTAITQEEIHSFYSSNVSNFTLSETLVKALYIKVRKNTPYTNKIRELYRSTREDDIKALDNIAYQVAEKYDFFGDKWLPFSFLQRQLPYQLENPDDYFANRRTIEMEDGDFQYLVNIRDIKFKGQTSPIEYESANIRSVILNKRKQKIINDLENNIYNNALDHKRFQIF